MVRRHGWAGSPPAGETEARTRIIAAAMRCIDEQGAASSTLADVAAALGVTRQTVYRYYASTEELFIAVGRAAVETYVEELTVPLAHIRDPGDWVVETLALAIELLPTERYLTLLLVSGRTDQFSTQTTSTFSMDTGRALLNGSAVDWAAEGYDAQELDELTELMLRILQSMTIDPPRGRRTGDELRRYLRRWIAPALTVKSRSSAAQPV